MKTKIILLAFVLTGFIILTGCPYSSKFSISDAAQSVIDTTLLGTWEGYTDKDKDEYGTIDFFKFNDHEYFVEMTVKNKANTNSSKFRVFISSVGDIRFFNVQELGNKDKFTFYKYSLSNGVLKFSEITDEYVKEQFSSREELVNYISKKIDDPKLFSKENIFTKKK